jgi:hypothetical protein
MVENRIDVATLKDILKSLPTPHELDGHFLAEWLVSEYGFQRTEQTNLGRGEFLGWALASLWREHFMPEQIAPEFAREWHNFLVLEVGYFYPFRKAKRLKDRLAKIGFPNSLAQIGALLADEEHLADVIADPYQSRLASPAENLSALLKVLVPNPNDPDKGAVPLTTVAARRDVALKSLAEELTKLQVATSTPTVATSIAPQSDPPIHLPPASPPTENDLADLEGIALDNFLLTDLWVKKSFKRTRPSSEIAGLTDKVWRLAEYLAAIQLQIEPGPAPTPRLVRQNVNRALRGIGIEPDRERTGDLLMDFLEQARILKLADNYWEFANPNLVDFFGARFVADYGHHWASLRPRHRRLMQWTAALLARRGDDQRTQSFISDLMAALCQMSPLSWLDVVDIVAEFQGFETLAISEIKTLLAKPLGELARVKSDILHSMLFQRCEQLGIDVGLADSDWNPETVIPLVEMEKAAVTLSSLLVSLGLPLPAGSESAWLEDRKVLRALLDQLLAPDSELKIACAAWLQRSTLSPIVEVTVPLDSLWKSRAYSALEAVAQIALDPQHDEFTRTLARSILACDEAILRLWELGETYQPLAYTLLLLLDKRLQFNSVSRRWQIVE